MGTTLSFSYYVEVVFKFLLSKKAWKLTPTSFALGIRSPCTCPWMVITYNLLTCLILGCDNFSHHLVPSGDNLYDLQFVVQLTDLVVLG